MHIHHAAADERQPQFYKIANKKKEHADKKRSKFWKIGKDYILSMKETKKGPEQQEENFDLSMCGFDWNVC